MAETFLFSVSELLITKLASIAYEEAFRVLGVYDDLQEIKQTLSFIKAVLLDAEQKQEHNNELQEWLRQIKHIFSEAEDVLDEFECEELRKEAVNASGSTRTKVGSFFTHSNPLVFRHRMARQIKEIKKRLGKIAADRQKFGLEIIDVDKNVLQKREMTHSHVISSDVIGRKDDKENIMQLLLQHHPNDGDKGLSVIPVVGIGGLGKTTLAKFVFNDKRIDESFSSKLWVCVSDDFDIKQLMIKILHSATCSTIAPTTVGLNYRSLDVEQLQCHLRNNLESQKFLLVLDDVWNEDRVKWLELRNLLQVGAEGSKILVTTRSRSIASMMGTIPSYNLQGLSQEDSLSLFVKWAFKEGEEKNYLNLVEIGKEIVKKCGGVPLAVRTLGSSLFSKLETNVWESVRDSEIWNLPQKKDDFLPALKLSYDQMSSHLRQCFALFSLYPKDYQFSSFEVTCLWGALGLLPLARTNQALEDVTNQYLDELLSRSFLQDVVNYGTRYGFKIHDLVHDLALYVGKDECSQVNSDNQSISENTRHLSFFENDLHGQSSTQKSTRLRTILFPVKGVGAKGQAFLDRWVSRSKFLRVLGLGYSEYETLPRSIGKLRHLRCLSLQNNKKIKKLPDSICKLHTLQVLSLDGCTELEMLPKGLKNLISLRHLDITTKQAVLPEDEIANLSSLQILRINICQNILSLFQGKKLSTLKGLSVSCCGSLQSLPLDAEHFPQLETLEVHHCENLILSKGHEDQNSNLKLRLITFSSLPQMVMLPYWVVGSANTLQSLIIANCELIALPNWLSTLNILKTLIIMYCPRLVSLLEAIHTLPALEHLKIHGCPELCRKYKPQVGEYWSKISHIKHIDIGEP
ncbi:hypothetical protein RIF29_34799 [Crotalaria pallida]|uniref:Uncharacterized protein n=1 Tax=Crotalaria pallida TaxID=3830 RepID=A0AAN9EBH5_CROPI